MGMGMGMGMAAQGWYKFISTFLIGGGASVYRDICLFDDQQLVMSWNIE
jgi:hypothetical protein